MAIQLMPKKSLIQVTPPNWLLRHLPQYVFTEVLSESARADYLKALTKALLKPKVRKWLEALLFRAINNVRSVHQAIDPRAEPNGSAFSRRALAAITASGEVFIAGEGPNGNPPLWVPSEIALRAALSSSGRLSQVVAFYVLDGRQARSELLSGDGVDAIRYLIDAFVGDAVVIGAKPGMAEPIATSYHTGWPGPTFPNAETAELKQRAPRTTEILFELPYPFDYRNPQPELIEAIIAKMKVLFGNSTSDGKAKPATKGHIAAAVKGRQVLFAVNARDPNWPSMVRCAEVDLAALACTLGWKTWGATFVYSPDYRSNNGDSNLHVPRNCPICLAVLNDRADGRIKNMLLVNTNGQETVQQMISEASPSAYSRVEPMTIDGSC